MCCCNWWALTLRTVCLETRVSYRHLTFMIETFELLMKSCKNLICYACIFNVQLHVHLKKGTLKFKLLYLRNYLSYFNKIHRISCVNTHIKSLNVWLKSILPWLKYSIFFLGDCFLLAHPVYIHTLNVHDYCKVVNILGNSLLSFANTKHNSQINFGWYIN